MGTTFPEGILIKKKNSILYLEMVLKISKHKLFQIMKITVDENIDFM